MPLRRRLGDGRHQRRHPLHLRDLLARRLRRDHGRLGVELEISFLGALRSAAQMVSYEVSIGFVIIGVLLLRRLAEPLRDRRNAGRDCRRSSTGSGCRSSRCSSSSSSRRWPRPTGRRSTCRRRNRTGRGLHGRILLDAVPDLHARRIRDRPDVRHDRRCCSSAAGCRRSTFRRNWIPGIVWFALKVGALSSSCSPW